MPLAAPTGDTIRVDDPHRNSLPVTRAILLADGPDALGELCGVPHLERWLRILERRGIRRVIVLSSNPEGIACQLDGYAWARPRLEVSWVTCPAGPIGIEQLRSALTTFDAAQTAPGDSRVLVFPAAMVCDERLVDCLAVQEHPLALVDSSPPLELRDLCAAAPRTGQVAICGPTVIDASWRDGTGPYIQSVQDQVATGRLATIDVAAQPTYALGLRRHMRPYWFPAPAPDQTPFAERLIVAASQKGCQDFPALAHAPIENALVSRISRWHISPNQLTALATVVAWMATGCFALGHLRLGVAIALSVGILDGLDGKLARVKVETTRAGRFEHVLDFAFEHSWWLAIAWSLHHSGGLPAAMWYWVILAAAEMSYALGGVLVLRRTGQMQDELSSFDRLFRLVGGRRNIYVWLLAAGLMDGLAGGDYVVVAVWALITGVVRVTRAICILAGHTSPRTLPLSGSTQRGDLPSPVPVGHRLSTSTS
jgi:phosphatidylglycerophosphate synthase